VTRSIRRLPAALALGTLAAGLLAACSAGQIAQTSQVVPAVPGAQGQITVKAPDQMIFVRNATLDYPGKTGYAQGGAAPLSLWIVNESQQAVTLTGVTSSAGQVRLEPGLNSASPCSVPRSPEAPPVPSTTASGGAINSLQPSTATTTGTTKATPSSTARPTASPSLSAAPSAAASSVAPPPSPAAPPSAVKVPIPAGGCVALNRESAQFLQIVAVTRAVPNGTTVPVTFTFVGADGQTYQTGELNLPVNVPASPNERTSPPAS
jgi:hypothetical protein